MDELYGMFDSFIESAKHNSGFQAQVKPSNKWKHCIILHKLGWKPNKFEQIIDPERDDIIIIWEKEGYKEIRIRLPWSDQCLWLEYLERMQEEKK